MNVNLKAFLITAGLVLLAAFSLLFIVQNMALAGNLFIIACLVGTVYVLFGIVKEILIYKENNKNKKDDEKWKSKDERGDPP